MHFFKGLDSRYLPESAFPQFLEIIKENPLQNSVLFYNQEDTLNQLKSWKKMLPWIDIYYAVKSNPLPSLLNTLSSYGQNFDCASKNEIKQVLRMGVDPERIIFSNPIKNEDDISWA